jgi:hypothetical protein
MRAPLSLTCLLAIASCSSIPVAPQAPRPEPNEHVIAAGDFGGVVNVRRGDVLIVRLPMAADEWQVAFDDTVLSPFGTTENLRHPGNDGWRFTVVGAGETTLSVTPVLRGGANPPRFTITVHSAP